MKRSHLFPAWQDGKLKAFTMSYDDGVSSDIRLCELMRRHGVKGTFNINFGRIPDTVPETAKAWRKMTAAECMKTYGDDMEIAVHGNMHPYWTRLSDAAETADILDDRRGLEQLFGRIIRGSASPNGDYDADTVNALRACGIRYCRTTKRAEGFLFPKHFEDPLHGFLALPTTAHNTDENLFDKIESFLAGSPRRAGRWLFYLWGHSYEFPRDDSWGVIEKALDLLGGRDDIWYATNIEIFDYEQAVRSLRFNVDQTMVENPSALDVFLRVSTEPSGDTVRVPAGQTVALPAVIG